MYPISPVFENMLRSRSRTWVVKVDIDGTEYNNSKIVSFEVENSLVSGSSFEIGTAIASKLTLTMRFSDVVPANARIIPYLAVSLDSVRWIDADTPWEDYDYPWVGGATEWLPLGEFYVDDREKVGNTWVYTCYDKLMFANAPFVSALTYPATQQAVWNEICTSIGLTYDSSVVIDPAYTFTAAPTGYTKRQVMGFIAGCNSSSVYIGKNGLGRFRRYSAADAPVYDLGPSDYTRSAQTNPIKTYTRIVATYDTTDDLSYEAGAGDDNATLYIDNPFITQDIVNALHANLNGFTYMPLEMAARGYPQLEAGDRVGYIRNESTAWIDTTTPWDNMNLPWDGLVGYETILLHTVFTFKGGLFMTIDAPSESEQKSEFQVDGTLTTAVNTLNKTTVKQGRHYFGVTITKEDGLIVERDDQASKVILNSDEMSFWADGERAIWFDVPSRRYKFSGILEASEIIGGKITGSEFEAGVITGGIITGTEINGGTITGSLVRTSASFPRTEMDVTGNFLAAYYSEDSWLKIIPFLGPTIQMNSGSYVGAISFLSGTLGLVADTVSVPSWSQLLNSATNRNLQQELNSLQTQISSLSSRVSDLESA